MGNANNTLILANASREGLIAFARIMESNVGDAYGMADDGLISYDEAVAADQRFVDFCDAEGISMDEIG